MKKVILLSGLIIGSISVANAGLLDALEAAGNLAEVSVGLVGSDPVITMQKETSANRYTANNVNGVLMLKNAPKSVASTNNNPKSISYTITSRQMGNCTIYQFDEAGGSSKVTRNGTTFSGKTYLTDYQGLYTSSMVFFSCPTGKSYNGEMKISFEDDAGKTQELSKAIIL